ncbi:hypothetical protein FNH08_10390 [Streptomyces spongiae]|uniref:PE-PGRS family protein n=2 Tax=Streptomyces spongiae TaxID=565072 RepID=A0A5N8XDE6_9ACTN|nr:hypothetical protein [Streptomyces spongiae]
MFAAVCVLFAVQGHALTSGVEVPWWALVAGAVVTGAMAWCLAGRERGLLAVGSLVVATQAALHASFSLAQAVVRPEPADGTPLAQRWLAYLLCSSPRGGSHSDGTAMTAHPMSHDMSGMDGAGGMGSMESTGHVMEGMSSTGMLLAHLVAALVCGLWLAHGERAAFRILRLLAGWLVAPLRLLLRVPAPPHRPRLRARRDGAVRALRQLLLVHAITSRGPPAGTAVL